MKSKKKYLPPSAVQPGEEVGGGRAMASTKAGDWDCEMALLGLRESWKRKEVGQT